MSNERIDTHFRKQIGINVGALREEKGLTQTDLSVRASMDRSYISEIENAKRNITLGIMIKLADGLDVPITALLAGLEHCPPSELDCYDYVTASLPR